MTSALLSNREPSRLLLGKKRGPEHDERPVGGKNLGAMDVEPETIELWALQVQLFPGRPFTIIFRWYCTCYF